MTLSHRTRLSSTPALVLIVVLGCSEEQACTADARHSVRVTLTDASGNVVTDGAVEYAVDGAAPGECESYGEFYVCGSERTGTFVITGNRGAESGSATA
jgi:hypothetical protein